jgi:hypothetical protein
MITFSMSKSSTQRKGAKQGGSSSRRRGDLGAKNQCAFGAIANIAPAAAGELWSGRSTFATNRHAT